MVKGCLLFCGSIVAGLGIGSAVAVIFLAITGNDVLAIAIGTGLWFLLVPTIMVYASLWFSNDETISDAAKADNKMQTAELRMGFIFAIIGGAIAKIHSGSNLVITITAICCAFAGGVIGFDIKRRVRRVKERYLAQNHSDTNNETNKPA